MSEENRIAAILGEWLDDRERGSSREPEEVVREHPDLADDLRVRFTAIELLNRAFAGSRTDLPESLGDFRILGEIGRGGMGVVYEAEQTSMGRRVALKVLPPGLAAGPRAIRRFQREAKAAGLLSHTNIVSVHAMGEESGHWYYAMELVKGRPLSLLIDEMRSDGEPMALGGPRGSPAHYRRVAALAAGVADALETAHRRGVIHRDIKPGNLILDEVGALKVADFGLARMSPAMTAAGDLVGTPLYMSPEQAHARSRVDHRTDVYSLGATLYETLTLLPPFAADTLAEACTRVLHSEPTQPREADPRIPRDLETIVLTAMAKEPGARYATAGEMATDLRRFAEGLPILARRAGPILRAVRFVRRRKVVASLMVACVLLALAAGLVSLRWSESSRQGEYDLLCARAEAALYHPGIEWAPGPDPDALLTRAIALDPDRFEARLLRAQTPDSPVDRRLADADAAGSLGAPPGAVHLARALALEQAGRSEDAAREEELARESSDGGPVTTRLSGLLLLARGRTIAGVDRLSESTRANSDPSTAAGYERRALDREMEGDFEGALADLTAVLELRPACVETRVQAAWILSKIPGRAEEADARIHEIAAKTRDEAGWLALWQACRRVWAPTWMDLVSEQAVDAHPGSRRLRAARCESLFVVERYDEAIRRADELPPNAASRIVKARALQKLGRIEEALETVDRGLAAATGTPDAHLRRVRADVLLKLGRLPEALTDYDRAVAIAPHSWHCRINRSFARRLAGRFDEALEDCRAAFAARPNHAAAYLHLAYTLNVIGRPAEALEVCERGLVRFPDSRFPEAAKLHVHAAEAVRMTEGPLAAVKRMATAHGLHPADRDIEEGLAATLTEAGLVRDAVRILEALPGGAERDLQLGLALLASGLAEPAADAFARAAKAATPLRRDLRVLATRHRAHALSLLGRDLEASAELELADGLFPGTVRSRIPRLEALMVMGRYREVLAAAQDLAGDEARRRSWFLVRAARALGEDATELARAATLATHRPGERLDVAYLLAAAGLGDRARETLSLVEGGWTAESAFARARVHAVLGEADAAIEWLTRAARLGCRRPAGRIPDPELASIEAHPRFADVRERLELP